MANPSAKKSVELLCSIVHSFGFTKVSPEDFRQAKFNDPQICPKFWRLLFEMIYFTKYACLDEVCTKAYELFSMDEIQIYTRHSMLELGFFSSQFVSSTPKASVPVGSRELLLAFGWILCREGLMHKLHLQCISSLTKPSFGSNDSLFQFSPNSMSDLTLTDSFSELKKIIWINGKLRMNLKQLYWLRRQNHTYMHRIHQSTTGITSPSAGVNLPKEGASLHLSSYDVYLMKHPDILCQHLTLLEVDNARLNSLLAWRQYERDFWCWMESVLDAKLSEEGEKQEEQQLQSSGVDQYQLAIQQLSNMHKTLHDSLVKYESIALQIEEEWHQRNVSQVNSQELDIVIQNMNKEIDLLYNNIAWVKQQLTAGNWSNRFHFQTVVKNTVKSQGNGSQAASGRYILDGVSSLKNISKALEKKVSKNERYFEKELDFLSKKYSNIIFQDALTAQM